MQIPAHTPARRVWLVIGLVTLAFAVVYLALPDGGLSQAITLEVPAIVATVLIVVRLTRDRLALVAPWRWLLLATVLYTGVSPFWGLVPIIRGEELLHGSWVDAAYFLSYAFVALFLMDLIRRRHASAGGGPRAELVALIDAALIAVAVTSVLWPLLWREASAAAGASTLHQALGAGYVIVPAVLLGLAARLITSDVRSSPVHLLLLVWIGGELAGDIFYGYLAAAGTFYYGHPVGVAWIVSYVALAALAVHPSLAALGTGTTEMRLKGWRLWLPFAAVLVPLSSSLIEHSTMVEVFAGIAVVLNIARLRILSIDVATQHRLQTDLEVANQSLEHFVSVASHDLRTPLATTHGLLETFATRSRTPLEDWERNLLDRAIHNTSTHLETIDALLVLARSRESEVQRRHVDVAGLVAEVEEMLATELESSGASLRLGALAPVDADPVLMRVLVQNLLSNAVKFREPRRDLVIDVDADRAHGAWRLRVADNGRGFEPADRERIFELFGRTADEQGPAGAGIGLATCRRIVEHHGGSIEATPLSEGAAFTVNLPEVTPHAETA